MYEKMYIRALFFGKKPPAEERAEKADLQAAAPEGNQKGPLLQGAKRTSAG